MSHLETKKNPNNKRCLTCAFASSPCPVDKPGWTLPTEFYIECSYNIPIGLLHHFPICFKKKMVFVGGRDGQNKDHYNTRGHDCPVYQPDQFKLNLYTE